MLISPYKFKIEEKKIKAPRWERDDAIVLKVLIPR